MNVQTLQTRKQLLEAIDRERTAEQRATLERSITAVGVQETVKEHFPELWPAVDVGLSVCASLLLADNVNPVAVVYVGAPSSGKTTVVNMFADHPLTYLSDKFTTAAFVSNAANVEKKKLEQVDLLPRIKHKVLLTPELAPTFRGKEDELAEKFSTLTRVLDGEGLLIDSGTHGQRGYRGDYLFAWLGCTTPLEPKVWRIMAQLGSRLFFFDFSDQEEQPDLQDMLELLKTSQGQQPYRERLKACKEVIHRLLTALYPGVTAEERQEKVRSGPASEDETQAIQPETPHRAYAVLRHIARGHALVHGRTQLTVDDLFPVAQVAISTMPRDYARVLRALVQHKELTVAQVMTALRVKHHDKADKVMSALEKLEIVRWERPGKGKTSFIHFASAWERCLESGWKGIFHGQPMDNSTQHDNLALIGGCVRTDLAEDNLVQRQNEKDEEEYSEERSHSQPPKNARLAEKSVETKSKARKAYSQHSRLWEETMNMPIPEGMKALRGVHPGRRLASAVMGRRPAKRK